MKLAGNYSSPAGGGGNAKALKVAKAHRSEKSLPIGTICNKNP